MDVQSLKFKSLHVINCPLSIRTCIYIRYIKYTRFDFDIHVYSTVYTVYSTQEEENLVTLNLLKYKQWSKNSSIYSTQTGDQVLV